MIKEEIIKKIEDFRELGIDHYFRRESEINIIEKSVSTIIGSRRSGKSYRMYQIIDDLISESFINSIEQVCILDFDNPIFANMKSSELLKIEETFLYLNPEYTLKTPLLFIFDEIHKIKGWEDYVINLSRNGNWKVFITGSSSKLLKNDIATELRGKSITSEVYPLSFKEFLLFNNIEKITFSTRGKAQIQNLFEEYLKWGSFPIIPKTAIRYRSSVLREYFDTMILNDILQRYNVSNPKQCIKLYNYLLSNIAKPYTVKSAYKFIKSQNMSISVDAINKYIDYAQDAFLIFSVPIFTDSLKLESRNYKKLYCIDWGIANHNSLNWDGYYSRAFENMIYIHLKRKYKDVRYYLTQKARREVDFIISDDYAKPIMAIQASMSIDSKETLKREVTALIKTATYFNIKENFIITNNNEQIIKENGITINVMPAYKFLTMK